MLDYIKEFHAHVYFDEASLGQAVALCEEAAKRFSVVMGRVHQKPIGPHVEWNCQLLFCLEKFGELVPWLALNRQGLSILVHPDIANDLKDHTDHAIWLGEVKELNLDIFR